MSESSTLSSCVLVDKTYAVDNHLPDKGEVIVVHISQPFFGPGSDYDLHAVVLDCTVHFFDFIIRLTVLPMPTYSTIDPESGLSSSKWLLNQPINYQNIHIPVPYEQVPPVTQPHSLFPTPAHFGDPIELGGWKNSRPCWIQVVPRSIVLTYTTKFKCYNPPVRLSANEVGRLEVYGGFSPSPFLPDHDSGTVPAFPLGGGSAVPGAPDALSLGKDTVPGNEDSGYGGVIFGAGRSSVLQSLYATVAVKQALLSLWYHDHPLTHDSDYDDDDDDDWENEMDPLASAKYRAAHLANIVQDHDDKMCGCLFEGIASWVKGILKFLLCR